MVDNDLEEIILSLLDKKKEGIYWDFKECWYVNENGQAKNIDLIHDIICLANARHNGERYLIFGIKDITFEIIGIEENSRIRKKQNEVIDLLKNASFANGTIPNIIIRTINIDGKGIDVLIIADEAQCRPYYLIGEYQENKSRLYPGTIYTRVGDTNTAKNKTASLYDTEYMWKERFGINKTALERVIQYLQCPEDWEHIEESNDDTNYYHRYFPEFTLSLESVENNFSETHYFFSRSYCQGSLFHSFTTVKIYNIVLGKVLESSYHGGFRHLVVPKRRMIHGVAFEYYIDKSLEYYMQRFYSIKEKKISLNSVLRYMDELRAPVSERYKQNIGYIMPLFKDNEDIYTFIEYVKNKKEDYNHSRGMNGFTKRDDAEFKEQNELWHDVFELYQEYKKI